MRISTCNTLERRHEVIAVAGGWIDPQHREGAQDGSYCSKECEPVAFNLTIADEFTHLFVAPVECARIFSYEWVARRLTVRTLRLFEQGDGKETVIGAHIDQNTPCRNEVGNGL